MKFLFISTFLERSIKTDALLDHMCQLKTEYSEHDVHWLVTSGDRNINEYSNSFCTVIIREDENYLEGWNHALEYIDQNFTKYENYYVIFIGEGDKIISLPVNMIDDTSISNIILAGSTIRLSSEFFKIQKSRCSFLFLDFKVPGWLPSYAFPIRILRQFKFPEDELPGGDLALLYHVRRKVPKIKICYNGGFLVSMEVDGQSSNIIEGNRNRYNIAKKFGSNSVIIYLLYIVRLIKYSLKL